VSRLISWIRSSRKIYHQTEVKAGSSQNFWVEKPDNFDEYG